jgi:hypothetical protein
MPALARRWARERGERAGEREREREREKRGEGSLGRADGRLLLPLSPPGALAEPGPLAGLQAARVDDVVPVLIREAADGEADAEAEAEADGEAEAEGD